jgi:uncharacterized protein (DUF433 family)
MQDLLNRITFNKDVLCGKPLIRGLRISVDMILELLAKGSTEEEILQDYPQLESDDLRTRCTALCPSYGSQRRCF